MSKPLDLQDGTGVIANIPGIGVADAYGSTVPSDAAVGYVTGCLFRKIDGGAGTSLYVNEGDQASCDFNAVAGA